ncbi:hypothetical protein HETIRDRAFT_481275 [Heterobasidion irregulare TC 32-1]|uniref:Uncharacterized protein n=1 Tax=Heterobasidion irregulare (strain TC 32-1) TaxID=747525 RepID=W4JQI5_HETIT|nr:uncharacterized protein HETIRDRAFT_481275 [Heterobasidion irregulare TC 32-1]ETW75783.1 hypothetical protein HETIRDRAFT_481275 [Heterobasidion irregulare TC 32-1]
MTTSAYTRVAVVTGAAQGIGRSIALRLAADGLNVIVNDLQSQQGALGEVVAEIETKGVKAVAYTGNVSVEDDVKNLVQKAVEKFGRLDVMVANAGFGGQISAITDVSLDEWRGLMSVNLDGVVLCYKYAAAQMIKQGDGGRLIAASSICGKKGFARLTAYCASKFAIRGLTQCLALELAEHNITVNAYAPGIIPTKLTKSVGDGGLDPIKELMKLPDARTGTTEDIAAFVSHVASPQSKFMTGQTVIIDGGICFD